MTLFTEDMRRDPFAAYAHLRSTTPVMRTQATTGGYEAWLLFRYDDVKRALTEHATFGSNVGPTRQVRFEWLMFTDPPRHATLRAIVSQAFTPRSIAELEPRIARLAARLFEAALERREIDWMADFATPLPLMVIAEMLGIEAAEWPRLRRWSEAIVNLGATIIGTPEDAKVAGEAFASADAEIGRAIAQLARERRGSRHDDLIARLVSAEVDGERLTETEIVRFVELLLAAGTETTTNLLANAMLCFLEHPGELERLRASPPLLPSAIEEVLRYRSPAQVMFRTTLRDVEVGENVIPAGRMVMPVIGAANRDPSRFADPDRFDVARAPNPHVAFGHGIHFCLGAPLSRLEAKVALGQLLARTSRIERTTQEAWKPRLAFHVHGPEALPIRITAVRGAP